MCNIHCFFTTTEVALTRLIVTLCAQCRCCYHYDPYTLPAPWPPVFPLCTVQSVIIQRSRCLKFEVLTDSTGKGEAMQYARHVPTFPRLVQLLLVLHFIFLMYLTTLHQFMFAPSSTWTTERVMKCRCGSLWLKEKRNNSVGIHRQSDIHM